MFLRQSAAEGMFEIYKKGQGTAARWVAAVGLGGMAAFGCFSLQEFISGYSSLKVPLGLFQAPVSVLVSSVAFLAAAVLVAVAVNHPRFVDYLIMSEVELRKVSWPTRDELKRQTAVVILAILLISALLLVADILFAFGTRQLYGF